MIPAGQSDGPEGLPGLQRASRLGPEGTGEKMGLSWALDGDWIGGLMGSGEI